MLLFLLSNKANNCAELERKVELVFHGQYSRNFRGLHKAVLIPSNGMLEKILELFSLSDVVAVHSNELNRQPQKEQ